MDARVILFSNYECLTSHYSYGYGEHYEYDGILKQIIDILYLNPRKLRFLMNTRWGVNIKSHFPNLSYRDGKEFVTYLSFIEELENNMGYSLLNFFGEIIEDTNPENRININSIKKIIIPKGAKCGLLDHFNGGGSIWDMVLLKDMSLNLGEPFNRFQTKYDTFELVNDQNCNYGYSAHSIACPTNEFWENEFSIIESKN